jgi:hypothetical protein
MRTLFVMLLAAAALWHASSNAVAQMGSEETRPLRGLKSIRLSVEGIDDEAQKCGVTESLIREAFLFPLSQSRIKFTTDKMAPLFWVRANVLIQERPGQCISSLELAVVNYQRVQLDYLDDRDEPPVWAFVRLWDAGTLLVGTRHAERVRAAVENATKKFVTTWNLANRLP